MRDRFRNPLVFLLVSAFFIATATRADEPVGGCTSGQARAGIKVAQPSRDVKLVQSAPGLAMERITGQAALSHLRNLHSRNPAAFVESRKKLKALGYEPTDQVYVERTIRNAKSKTDRSDPYLLLQNYSEQNGDGEIVFWSWTDGNDSTWEGSIYVEIYDDGAASTWDGQIDASTEAHPWVWYQKTWERPAFDFDIGFALPPLPGGFNSAIVLASSRPMSRQGILPVARGFGLWANCWRDFVVGGCITAAIGCRASGPGWAACFGGWCFGAEVAGAVVCYMQNP